MACGRLGAEKDTAQGDVDNELPLFWRDVPRIFHDVTNTGVVDQHIYLPEGRIYRLEQLVDRLW